jgi:hypothetical protein
MALTAVCLSQNNNVERAADWIFSHMDDLDAPVGPFFAFSQSLDLYFSLFFSFFFGSIQQEPDAPQAAAAAAPAQPVFNGSGREPFCPLNPLVAFFDINPSSFFLFFSFSLSFFLFF